MNEIRSQAIAVLEHYGLLESANVIRVGGEVSAVLKAAAMNPLVTPDQKDKLIRLSALAKDVEICVKARGELESLRQSIKEGSHGK